MFDTCMYKMHFLRVSATSPLPAAGLFSRSRLRARRRAACTLRRECGPPPGSVARALGIQSRGELALFAGSLSAQPDPSRSMETPKLVTFPFFHLSASVSEAPQQLSKAGELPYNSRASSFPLCDSHERCFCVCVRERACVIL